VEKIMAVIQVTPESLRGKASNVRQKKQAHDQAMSELKSLINALNAEWKGVASDTFLQQFNSMQTQFTQFSQRLETMAKKMDDTATQLQTADEQAKSAIVAALQA
jgi:WXG100 family type VII secretion target